MANLHISISAEPIFSFWGIDITNSMLVSWIVTGFLCIFAILVSRKIKFTKRPKGVQSFLETIIENLYNLVSGIAGERRAITFFPYIATFFIFILLANWFGLLPGVGTIGLLRQEPVEAEMTHDDVETTVFEEADNQVAMESAIENQTEESNTATKKVATSLAGDHQITQETPETTSDSQTLHETETHAEFVPILRGATADINVTLALAVISVVMTQFVGLKFLGFKYLGKFFNFSNPINFFIGILELIAELAKIMSFAFRLFGNIFAGEVLLAVMAFLIPVFAPLPFIGLEIFVGLVQALVFSMLTLVFMNLATLAHSEEH